MAKFPSGLLAAMAQLSKSKRSSGLSQEIGTCDVQPGTTLDWASVKGPNTLGSFPSAELWAVSPAGPAWPLPPSDSLHWVPLALWWKWPPHSSHPICLADYFQLGLQRPNAAITPQPQWLLLKITFGSKKTSVWWAGFYTKQLKSGCGHGG